MPSQTVNGMNIRPIPIRDFLISKFIFRPDHDPVGILIANDAVETGGG